jgi:hypothetical protein
MNTIRDGRHEDGELVDSRKIESKDQKFDADVSNAKFVNRLFVRLVSKGHKFTRVDFRYCTFDACYLRSCVFDECDFTGCRFVSTNLHGSSFSGCKFDYATFERTDIDDDVLSTGCPATENLKLRFARSLRVNYQQLGNVDAVNKAIAVELDATEVYLHKSWASNESYYRKKYARGLRIRQFARWARFKILDFAWGNGESTYKLLRAVILVLLAIAIVDVQAYGDPTLVGSYLHALAVAPALFLGAVVPISYPSWYVALIMFARLVFLGFFIAVIVKRLSRR